MPAIKKLRAGLTFANVTALSALVFAMAGSSYALSMPHPDGVLHGCVSNRTQALRVVGSSASCHRVKRRHGHVIDRGEFPIAWSQRGPRGPQGPTGAAGTAGRTGPTGTVDTSQFDTRAAADQRYERATRITYGSADSSANGQLLVAWPQLGFEITTAGPASLGNIALNVTNIGTQNINGEAMIHNGPPANTISAFPFGLSPGATTLRRTPRRARLSTSAS